MSWQTVASKTLLGAAGLAGNVALVTSIDHYLQSAASPLVDDLSSPQIPVKRQKKGFPKTPQKTKKKESLSKYSDGVNAGLAAVVGAVGLMSGGMIDSASADSSSKKEKNDALKLPFANAPLLANQIHLKQSVQDLVDAINSNTIVSATFLAPISANLKAISGTLIAISSTLLEISDNYSSELETADDLPYMDTESFYALLEKVGMPFVDAVGLKQQELTMIKGMTGSTYSGIKAAVNQFRNALVPPEFLSRVGTNVSGITAPRSVDLATGQPLNSAFPDMKPLNDWAASAKPLVDFKLSPQKFNDLDGNFVAEASPAELEAIKHASDARHKTDINNQEFEDDDFNNPFDLIPTIPFIGRESVFDTTSPAPTSNPFLDSLKRRFASIF